MKVATRIGGLLVVAGTVVRADVPESPAERQEERVSIRVYSDALGNLSAVTFAGDWIPVTTEVRVPSRDWARVGLTRGANVRHAQRTGTEEAWTLHLELQPSETFLCLQRWAAISNGTVWDVEVTSETDLPTAGIYLFIRLPTNFFRRGNVMIQGVGTRSHRVDLPDSAPSNAWASVAEGHEVTIVPPGDRFRIRLHLSRPCPVRVQDERCWGDPAYGLLIALTTNTLGRSQSVSLRTIWMGSGRPECAPVLIRLRPDPLRGPWHGTGGNVVFDATSPVTDFCRETLTSVWVRTAMSLEAWEPVNDNASPTESNWSFFEAQDRSGSPLREELERAAALARAGRRHVISLWYLPSWMIEGGVTNRETFGQRIDPRHWPEVLESIGSYLVYARLRYGIAPELVSFNEPDVGVHVGFSPHDYARMVRDLGQRLQTLGLSTRVLLGDLASPTALGFLDPVLSDPEARRQIGAVAFHVWAPVGRDVYAAWKALSEHLEVPLLVTELGPHPDAWRTPWFLESPVYALEELRLWQEVLAGAYPAAIFVWQFTGNYSLARPTHAGITPFPRYGFVRHFCNLTPVSSHHVETESSHPTVLASAFMQPASVAHLPVWTVHIANLGAAREALLTGLPNYVRSFRVQVSTPDRSWQMRPPVVVHRGRCAVELPALSLTTLTTAVDAEGK